MHSLKVLNEPDKLGNASGDSFTKTQFLFPHTVFFQLCPNVFAFFGHFCMKPVKPKVTNSGSGEMGRWGEGWGGGSGPAKVTVTMTQCWTPQSSWAKKRKECCSESSSDLRWTLSLLLSLMILDETEISLTNEFSLTAFLRLRTVNRWSSLYNPFVLEGCIVFYYILYPFLLATKINYDYC